MKKKRVLIILLFIFIIFTGLVNSQQKSQQKILKPKLEKRPVYNDLTIKTLNYPKNIKPEQPSTQGLLNPDLLPDLTLSDVRIESDGSIRWLRFIIKNENWKHSEISLNDPHNLSVQIYALWKHAQVLGLSQRDIDYINQHGSTQIQFPWDYTEDTKITVDYGNVVDESNERNNTFILRQ